MKEKEKNRCPACQVYINDDTHFCPLCGSVLEGEYQGVNTYPDVKGHKRIINLTYRIMVFIAVAASLLCVTIDFMRDYRLQWSLFVVAASLYAIYITTMFIKDNKSYKSRLFFAAVATVLFLSSIDYLVGFRRWSVNYVLPVAIIVVELFYVLMMALNFRNWQSYIILECGMVVVSLLPIVLAIAGISSQPLLGYIALGLSLFVFLGVVIIGGSRARAELSRRFRV